MLELVIIACALSNPTDCRKERIAWEDGIIACAIHGQQAVAEWAVTRPKLKVERWTCGAVRRDA